MSESRMLAFGLMAAPLTEQLADRGYDVAKLEAIEADNQAINRLYMREILTPSEVDKARTRLVKAIGKLKPQ